MGRYERAFTLDGVNYDPFAQVDDDETLYQLVDQSGREVGEPFADVVGRRRGRTNDADVR
jgi:hypothetical protein